MGLGLKRAELQAIALAKLEDAIALAKARRYSNAYYLAGYSVEIGLKACIAKQIAAETIPEKAFITQVYSHRFKELAGLAGLTAALKKKQGSDANFGANWALIAEWSPDSRYESKDPTSAQALVAAIADPTSGVLPWIKIYW